MAETFDLQIKDGVAASITPKLDAIYASALKADQAVTSLAKALGTIPSGMNVSAMSGAVNDLGSSLNKSIGAATSAASAMQTYGAATSQAASAQAGFAASTGQAATVLGTVGAQTQRTTAALGQHATQVQGTKESYTGLIAEIGGLVGAYEVLHKAFDEVQSFQQLQNRLLAVSEEGENTAATLDKVAEVARSTHQSVESVADTYSKLTIASHKLNLTQDDVLQVTKTLNQFIAASGVSSQTAAAGLYQLTQGLESGKLQGQDLRSVLSELPTLARALAKELGTTVSGLRDMGAAGQLTSQQVVQAFLRISSEGDEAFGKMHETIGQALTDLNSSFTLFIGKLDQSTGFSRGLVSAIDFLSSHIEAVAPVLEAVGTAAVLYLGTMAVGAVTALTTAIAANPIGAVATIITTLIVPAIITWQEKTGGLTTLFTTMGGVATTVLDTIINGYNTLATSIDGVQRPVSNLNQSFMDYVTGASEAKDSTESFAQTSDEAWTQLYNSARHAVSAVHDTSTELIDLKGKLTSIEGTYIIKVVTTSSGTAATPSESGENYSTYATGGSFRVGGKGGTDSQLVQFYASPDERVDVLTPAQQMERPPVGYAGQKNGKAAFAKGGSGFAGYSFGANAGKTLELPGFNIDIATANDNGFRPFARTSASGSKAGYEPYYDDPDYQAKVAKQAEELSNILSELSAHGAGKNAKRQARSIWGPELLTEQLDYVYVPPVSSSRGGSYKANDFTWDAAYKALKIQAKSGTISAFRNTAEWADTFGSATGAPASTYSDDSSSTSSSSSSSSSSTAATTYSAIAYNTSGLDGYATGGQFQVGGAGGTDSQLVQFLASPDERVTVETPAQQNKRSDSDSGVTIDRRPTINFNLKDARTLKTSSTQVVNRLKRALAN